LDLQLNEKVAVITGGSEGIGFAAAKLFLEEGCRVAICGRSGEKLISAVKNLSENNSNEKFSNSAEKNFNLTEKVFAMRADMTKESDAREFAAAVKERFGRIDIWVNNVGASFPRTGEWYSADEIDRTYAVCFKSVVLGSQFAAPYLKETHGVIINVASLAARCATAGRASLYGPLKSAVVNYTNTFAAEVAADQIRVACIMPGFTLTPLAARTISREDLERNANETLLARAAAPEEIAAPIVFLASGRASYITSTALEVSGGRSTVLNPRYSYIK
jgi:3-oxoacyl-[acyl-carrier protein] reductase